MTIEVSIRFSECDNDWEVNVWDVEEQENAEELEKVFPTEEDAVRYVDSLVKDKCYVVHHR